MLLALSSGGMYLRFMNKYIVGFLVHIPLLANNLVRSALVPAPQGGFPSALPQAESTKWYISKGAKLLPLVNFWEHSTWGKRENIDELEGIGVKRGMKHLCYFQSNNILEWNFRKGFPVASTAQASLLSFQFPVLQAGMFWNSQLSREIQSIWNSEVWAKKSNTWICTSISERKE